MGYGKGLDFTGCNNSDQVMDKLRSEMPEVDKSDYHITSVHMFKNKMKLGDLVIVSDGNRKFRAIGKVSGDYMPPSEDSTAHTRPVEWLLVPDESQPYEKILKSYFSQMTIYKLKEKNLKKDVLIELLSEPEQTEQKNLSIFKDLKKLGVTLALDDFGRGCSSLASIKHLNVECLKIDKIFIDDMVVDENAKRLVSSMIEIGHNFCHRVIAEGVEELEQFKIIQEMGCEAVQGYLFSKPVSADEISKLIDKKYPV